eukprot:jgi/Psemu1/66389/estExt_Genemark1.C_2030021
MSPITRCFVYFLATIWNIPCTRSFVPFPNTRPREIFFFSRQSPVSVSSSNPSTMAMNDDYNNNNNNNNNTANEDESPVILLVGTCCLDRLFAVAKYPTADAKIRSTSYKEVGGGNAANSASGTLRYVTFGIGGRGRPRKSRSRQFLNPRYEMICVDSSSFDGSSFLPNCWSLPLFARFASNRIALHCIAPVPSVSAIAKLVGAELFSVSGRPIRVEFLSKVGDDSAGQVLIDELDALNVGTSSPLFRKGGAGSTSAHTAIIVCETEKTRTCIHTPGSAGELSMVDDVQSLSKEDVDALFRNVLHVHSDSRHTDVALWIAKEAKRRGITVSCDCEKDRGTKALDELIDVCDILFTNSNYLGEYVDRLTREREAATGRQPLPEPTIAIGNDEAGSMASLPLDPQQERRIVETYVNSLTPSGYFARWQEEKSVVGKEVVVTHGSMGALHYKAVEFTNWKSGSESKRHNTIEIEMDDTNIFRMRHSFDDGKEGANVLYEIHQAGVLTDSKVVDTTGAGDSFIGGFILTNTAFNKEEKVVPGDRVQLALEIGSFVAGCKVGGSGRASLPCFQDIDRLGMTAADAKASLLDAIGSFDNIRTKETHTSG